MITEFQRMVFQSRLLDLSGQVHGIRDFAEGEGCVFMRAYALSLEDVICRAARRLELEQVSSTADIKTSSAVRPGVVEVQFPVAESRDVRVGSVSQSHNQSNERSSSEIRHDVY